MPFITACILVCGLCEMCCAFQDLDSDPNPSARKDNERTDRTVNNVYNRSQKR